ncbi:TIGR02679 family protein [Klenkia sp. LSe6-5]|uniref:TIGR02679 family protein n=1 Tax=Klenkia sesuvii TaxID=3103137 RepID=A0ABU8DX26_9ACTN
MTLLDELAHPSLGTFWSAARRQLERTGLEPAGTVVVELDDAGADLLGGVLGVRMRPGRRRIALADLDAVLRGSPAAVSLVEAAMALHGPLRDLPAERAARESARETSAADWAALVAPLSGAWVPVWTEGLRAAGLLRSAPAALAAAVAAVRTVDVDPLPRTLGELAAAVTGDAHGLDPGRRAGAVAVRGVAARAGEPAPTTAADRARLWAEVGVRTDDVSGTALVLGWRPPGTSAWAVSMRARADLGVPTHVTLRELRVAPRPWAAPDDVVHACENPQVVQAAADRVLSGPLICLQGNPSAAGSLLVEGLLADGAVVRYHGDFDWPGVAIAGRVLAVGARPWRLSVVDYRAAVPAAGVPLTGRPVVTPWDPELASAMADTGIAVHEEAVIDLLLTDLG